MEVKRVRAGNVDGRARNVRFVQNQLKNLHDVLVKNAGSIQNVMRSDSHNSSAEIEVEYHLALDCVKQHYEAIDFEQEMKDEYATARGEDLPTRRTAAGVVYITPSSHTLLYSVISPLSAAMAAQNCVVLELANSLLELPSLLGSLLAPALDRDTFAVVTSKPKEADVLDGCLQVYGQGASDSVTPSALALVSAQKPRVVAIVDRTADIDVAAERIVRARAAYGGKSSYAPDIVLVNEFRVKEFTDATVGKFTKYLSSGSTPTEGSANGSHHHKRRRGEGEEPLSREERNEKGTSVVLTGDNGTIVIVEERRSKLLSKKFTQPVLVIHPITSLDDAIDVANESETSLTALYTFGHPTATKYLSQFISARISYSNDIPIALLLGPSAPLDHPTSAHPRYTPSMFTLPCPSFAAPSLASVELRAALDEPKKARELRQKSTTALRETGQKPGGSMGYFEQGFVLGAVLIVLPVLAGTGVAVGFAVRAGLRRWR